MYALVSVHMQVMADALLVWSVPLRNVFKSVEKVGENHFKSNTCSKSKSLCDLFGRHEKYSSQFKHHSLAFSSDGFSWNEIKFSKR